VKTHLKTTIFDLLVRHINDAKSMKLVIEFISLYPKEYNELVSDRRTVSVLSTDGRFYASGTPTTEVLVQHRAFRVKSGYPRAGDFHQVLAHHSRFMGIPVYVIPEFCEDTA
jgi:hypothetical protein